MNLRAQLPVSARKLVFIDGGLDRLDVLLSGVESGFHPILIDPSKDGVEQIAAALNDADGIEALHIVSHGQPGALRLGATMLSLGTIDAYMPALARIRIALDDDAQVVLYGCEAGAGLTGEAFITELSEILGAPISATTTKTGAATLGGDWTFDIGAPATALAFTADARAAYPAVMANIFGSSAGGTEVINGTGQSDNIIPYPNVGSVNPNAPGVDIITTGAGRDFVVTVITDIADGDVITDFDPFSGPGDDEFDTLVLEFDTITQFSQEIVDNGNGGFDTLLTVTFGEFTRTQRFENVVGTFETYTDNSVGFTGTYFRLLDAADPIAGDDNFNLEVSSTLSDSVLGNDSVPGGGGTLTVSAVQGGNVGSSFSLPSGALLLINANGTFTYNPNNAFPGLGEGQSTTDSFTYTVSDGQGGTDTAVVTLSITNGNGSPIAQNDTFVIPENALFDSANLFNNNGAGTDSDPDGDTLTVTQVNGAATVGSVVQLANGTVTVTSNGGFAYDPNDGFTGVETFTYTVSDGEGGTDTATVNLTVQEVADAPVAQDDLFTTDEDVDVTGNVFLDNGNGFDFDDESDPFQVTAVEGSFANVGVATQLASGATVTLNANGTFTYEPAQDDTGTDSFTYTISDATGSDAAVVTISINAVNDAPIAENDIFNVNRGAILSADVSLDNGNGADSDPEGDDIDFAKLSDPANGTLSFDSSGSFFYVPNTTFSGVDSFTYSASDGNSTDTATVTINVIETTSTYSASVQPTEQGEGDLNATSDFVFTVTRSGSIAGGGTVDFDVVGGTQNPADSDDIGGAQFPDGTLSFLDGETTKTVTVTVTGDLVPEENETIDLVLSNPTNENGTAVIDGSAATATATILNDDLATLNGSNSRDKIRGTDDDDIIVGGGGDDRIRGDEGDDVILGGDGDDRIRGGDDDDIILGGDGDDRIRDRDGDNIIFGGEGDDDIRVKDGDNIIDGGADDDTMRAGRGDDTFVFKAGNDQDMIRNFDRDGSDKIDLSSFEGLTFAQLENELDQDGRDTVWETSTGDELILLKFDADDLSANDFIFATV